MTVQIRMILGEVGQNRYAGLMCIGAQVFSWEVAVLSNAEVQRQGLRLYNVKDVRKAFAIALRGEQDIRMNDTEYLLFFGILSRFIEVFRGSQEATHQSAVRAAARDPYLEEELAARRIELPNAALVECDMNLIPAAVKILNRPQFGCELE